MKVLIVNWAWYPTGGDWTYIENVKKMYENHGHEVIPFSTIHPKNIETNYNNYFVKSHDYKELQSNLTIENGIRAMNAAIISNEAVSKIRTLIEKTKPTIAHLQNIHHYITPAIIHVLKEFKIKIIWTLHDFKIICPQNSFISNGKVCEKCINGNFFNCALNMCKKESFLVSTLASIDAYYYHSKKIYDQVDYFLCPSDFLKSKFKQFGFDESKLHLAHSCYDIEVIDKFLEQTTNNFQEKYALYIGRLEDIKGVDTLIEAVIDTPIKLKIAGSGAAEKKLRQMAAGHQNIEFMGHLTKNEIFKLTQNAAFVVCPSTCYENLPFSVIESFLFSKAVIGSNIGGIPELIKEEETGLLFEAGNAAHLCEKMRHLWQNDQLAIEYGATARKFIGNLVNYDVHYKKIMEVIN